MRNLFSDSNKSFCYDFRLTNPVAGHLFHSVDLKFCVKAKFQIADLEIFKRS